MMYVTVYAGVSLGSGTENSCNARQSNVTCRLHEATRSGIGAGGSADDRADPKTDAHGESRDADPDAAPRCAELLICGFLLLE